MLNLTMSEEWESFRSKALRNVTSERDLQSYKLVWFSGAFMHGLMQLAITRKYGDDEVSGLQAIKGLHLEIDGVLNQLFDESLETE